MMCHGVLIHNTKSKIRYIIDRVAHSSRAHTIRDVNNLLENFY